MQAINGRLEHLRGSALVFRNLTNYIARSEDSDHCYTLKCDEPHNPLRLHSALRAARSTSLAAGR